MSMMKRWPRLALVAVSGLFVLAACSGGNEDASTGLESQLDYSNSAGERHSYTPYETASHAYYMRRGDAPTLYYIGGDLEPREILRHTLTEGGIRYFLGASRDGVGVDRLENYEEDLQTRNGTDRFGLRGNGFFPFRVQPTLYVDSDFALAKNAGILQALRSSVRILNDALPPEFQIIQGGRRTSDFANYGEIVVMLETPQAIASKCSATAAACAVNDRARLLNRTNSSVVYIPDDFDTSEYMLPRKVIIHELLHALGIWGHVDSVEFPDSIMGGAGEYIPNFGHVISKIDREVLQIMYMSQRTDLYNDWGEWSDTAFHVMGESEDGNMRFGVALFNGLPQPWANGVAPETTLAENTSLYGRARWSGGLVGFSGPSPIAGDAALEVDLRTLATAGSEHSLSFDDIYFVNRVESDSDDRWFHTRNIDYKVAVSGLGFWNVKGDGYEQGFVTGLFMGAKHEHMAGTVKRTDMIGAFGGSR